MTLEERDLRHIWHPCSQMKDYEQLPPVPVKSASGIYLEGYDGKKYMDIVSSWWCNLLGHCNPVINEAVKKQLDTLEHVIFANFTHEPAIRLCEELSEILPKVLTKFNFSDNGSASVECALKMSFQYQFQCGRTKKQRFLSLSEGYHGETTGALSVGAMDLYSKLFKPLLWDTIRVEAPDCCRCRYGKTREDCGCECFEDAERKFALYADECCAMIVEPLLQGSAGMRIYPPLYLKKLRELCNHYSVLLIADEIATGFGRTGRLFAFDHAGVSPDIICLSKGLTGGYLPMALTVTTDEIYNAFYADYAQGKAFMHSHTYSGNPLGCAAALAVQGILKDGSVLKRAQATGSALHQQLMERLGSHKNVCEIRNIGLINAIELVEDVESKKAFHPGLRTGYRIYQEALKKGLLLRPLGDVLYFNPPLIITEEECKKATELCADALWEILGRE